jgi:hypothetical protein
VSESNIWTIINDISGKKTYLLSSPEMEKMYVPWIVNKSFSAHLDTISAVEFVNRNAHLDVRMQHDYLFYSIPAKHKRWKPWLKKTDKEKAEDEVLNTIGASLGYNPRRTREAWKMLSEAQKKDLITRYVNPDKKNEKL